MGLGARNGDGDGDGEGGEWECCMTSLLCSWGCEWHGEILTSESTPTGTDVQLAFSSISSDFTSSALAWDGGDWRGDSGLICLVLLVRNAPVLLEFTSTCRAVRARPTLRRVSAPAREQAAVSNSRRCGLRTHQHTQQTCSSRPSLTRVKKNYFLAFLTGGANFFYRRAQN